MLTPADVTAHCQVVVKSFRRFDCLRKFLESLWQHYPGIEVILADDSLRPGETYPPDVLHWRSHPLVRWLQLPFHSGLSAGRNVAVQHVSKPYTVLCDDDFVVTDDAKLEALLAIVSADPDISLAGGSLQNVGDPRRLWWGGRIRHEGSHLEMLPLDTPWKETQGVRYRETECVYNFFVAETESLLRSPWDDRFKVAREHMNFFLTRKHAGLTSAYCPDACILHDRRGSSEYLWFRERVEEETRLFFDKWQLEVWDWIPPGPVDEPQPPVHRHLKPVTQGNIVVMGVGHSGTSILTEMLRTLGWQGNAFDEWHEDPEIRALNEQAWQGTLDLAAARPHFETMPRPWVVKDPRFCQTLDQWTPLFAEYEPLLIWITRDPAEVERSYERRGEGPITRGKTRQELLSQAETQFHNWPWAKVRIAYEDLETAVSLFRRSSGTTEPVKRLRIGLDLDGTVYAHPSFFAAMVSAMSEAGHEFYCTSSHGRGEWADDRRRLKDAGLNPDLISPELMYQERHGHVSQKARQADQLDYVFDDDPRVQGMTNTPQFSPLKGGHVHVAPSGELAVRF